jgi:hypothetical protein
MPLEAQRVCRGIAVILLNLSSNWGWVVITAPRLLTPVKNPVPIVQEAGWGLGPVWTSVKKRIHLGPTGVQTPNRPTGSCIYYISRPLHL